MFVEERLMFTEGPMFVEAGAASVCGEGTNICGGELIFAEDVTANVCGAGANVCGGGG